MKGLEPSRLAALAPKASVSTIPPHPHVIISVALQFYLYPGIFASQVVVEYNGGTRASVYSGS